jgi:hypothetical protein
MIILLLIPRNGLHSRMIMQDINTQPSCPIPHALQDPHAVVNDFLHIMMISIPYLIANDFIQNHFRTKSASSKSTSLQNPNIIIGVSGGF